MNKFLIWYIKGSSIYIAFLLVVLIAGSTPMIIARNSSLTVNWIYSFLIAISPLGAIMGYFVWFMFKMIFMMIGSMFGIESKKREVKIEKENNDCPYTGIIYTEKEGTFLGFSWPHSTPMFYIENDWKVYFSDKNIFGWVDKDGQIHKGLTMGDVNPDAIFGSEIIGRVYMDTFYIGDENIGSLRKN